MSEERRTVCTSIPREWYDKLQEIREEQQLSVSDLIRTKIKSLIDEHENQSNDQS